MGEVGEVRGDISAIRTVSRATPQAGEGTGRTPHGVPSTLSTDPLIAFTISELRACLPLSTAVP